ncbi:MAG: hypothetical protein MZU91_06955 [Desulfosudis oleivorans]|nr:hypothetical protein [Desulfosudis oleivorans]
MPKISDFQSRLSHGEVNLYESETSISNYLESRQQEDCNVWSRYIAASDDEATLSGLASIHAEVLYRFHQMRTSTSGRYQTYY